MHSTELIAAVRIAGQLPTADPSYPDARILLELTDMQQQLFERLLVATREGHLLQQYVVSTVAGTATYRLPARAVTQGAERIEIALAGDGRYQPITKLTPRQASESESSSLGQPSGFTMRGDSIQLFPTPGAVYSLRVHYYLRPGSLAVQQLVAPGTPRGLIAAHDATSIAVTALPHDMLVSPTAVIVVSSRVDVVRPDGSHDRAVVSARVATIAGPVLGLYTIGFVGDDLSRVQDGDYVRVAEQSEWAQLPPEFERTLCDATAAAILLSKGSTAKAQSLAGKVQSDIGRWTALLQPRVKDQPKVISPRYGVLRGPGVPRMGRG